MQNKEISLPNVLDIQEVALALHCKPRLIYKLVSTDKLKSFRVGNRIRIKEIDLLEYMNNKIT